MWRITISWPFGDVLCRLVPGLLKPVGMYASNFTVACMALDRAIAVLRPMSFYIAEQRAKALVAVSWIVAFLMSFPLVSESLAFGRAALQGGAAVSSLTTTDVSLSRRDKIGR